MSKAVEAPKEKSRPAPSAQPAAPGLGRLADAGLVAAFLALVALLGVFPLKDTDFWWHLRTGDLIRQTGLVPRVDTYTFGAEGHRWVDLHWLFQILLSYGYERIAIPGLNLAKCAVTALAVWLLISAKKRDWPTWVMVLAWLPALLVLAGRMYIRPETLTLLYLAAFLAILFRVDERPWLAFLLPVVQLAWVNSQGLFILGPVVLAFALVDAATRPGAFERGRRRWWTTILVGDGPDGPGLPGQSVRDRRGAVPAPARGDDGQPDLRDDRRARPAAELRPQGRPRERAAPDPPGDDRPRRAELRRADRLASRS